MVNKQRVGERAVQAAGEVGSRAREEREREADETEAWLGVSGDSGNDAQTANGRPSRKLLTLPCRQPFGPSAFPCKRG